MQSILDRLREVWQYRELTRNLVMRDLKVRYKSSILGVVWSWLNPLLMMVVYTIFFTIFLHNDNIQNYPVFLLCGLLPWNFFNESIAQATGSLVDNSHLIKKVYFPREILPISVVLSNLVNFLISLPVFFLLALLSGQPLSGWILLLPLTILLQVLLTIGLGFFLSTLNIFFRDTQFILNVLLLAGFFLTPVFYPINRVPNEASFMGIELHNIQTWLRRLNPMASIIASYRDLLYYGQPTGLDFLFRTTLTVVLVLIVGYGVFVHYSGRFGEEV
jgi:ABC-type polysaccharide/polyol phosphate export permease